MTWLRLKTFRVKKAGSTSKLRYRFGNPELFSYKELTLCLVRQKPIL
jgi:hypothetical protein